MARDDHDLVRLFPPLHLADDVRRHGGRERAAAQDDPHADGAPREEPLEEVGIRVRDGRRRNARPALHVIRRTRVREPARRRPDRPDENGERAVRPGLRGARGSYRDGRAVARALARPRHPAAEEDDPPAHDFRIGLHGLFQRLERLHLDDGRRDPRRRRPDAAAQRRDDEHLGKRRDDPGRLDATFPGRHGNLLGSHVREAELAEEGRCPGDGRPVAGSPGEAGPDFVREPSDPLRRTGGRGAPAGERGDRRARLGRERIGGVLGKCESGERRGEEDYEEAHAPAAYGHGTGVYGIR